MATSAEELFAALRREPDVEARNLVAVDATDRLLLDEAAPLLAAAGPGEVAVVDDSYGALTLAGGGHFLQEDVGPELARVVADLVAATPAVRP